MPLTEKTQMFYKNRPTPDQTKYPFKNLEVGQEIEITGDYRLIRCASYGFRKRHEMMFVVKKSDKSKDKVVIKRYK